MEDCNDDLALENEVLKQEVERLSQDLSKLKGKSVVQPSQDNRETMVKKLEKGSTVQNSCKLIQSQRRASLKQGRKIWIILSTTNAPTWDIMPQCAQSR